MPVMTKLIPDGDSIAITIKSNVNTNMNTPLVAISSSEDRLFPDFNYVLMKPLTVTEVETALKNLQ